MKQAIKHILWRVSAFLICQISKLWGRKFHQLLDEKTVVEIVRRKTGFQQTCFYAGKIFNDFNALAKRHGLRPKNILEIGPGSSLTTTAAFLCDGAEKATAIDIAPMNEKCDDYYRNAARYLAATTGLGWWRHVCNFTPPKGVEFNGFSEEFFLKCVEQVEYIAPVDVTQRIPIEDGTLDLVYSNAVLEHIDQPDAGIREIARVTSSGGLSIHEIDLRDHDSNDFLEFLKYPEETWKQLTGKYGDGGQGIESLLDQKWDQLVYCNRVRASQWRDIFTSAGFVIVSFEIVVSISSDIAVKCERADLFRNLSEEDLSSLVVRLVARKI